MPTDDTYGLGESYGGSAHLARLNNTAQAMEGIRVRYKYDL